VEPVRPVWGGGRSAFVGGLAAGAGPPGVGGPAWGGEGKVDIAHDAVGDVLLGPPHGLGEGEAERLRQVGGDGERRLPGAPFEQADVRPVDPRALGEFVHGHAPLPARVGYQLGDGIAELDPPL